MEYSYTHEILKEFAEELKNKGNKQGNRSPKVGV